MTRTSSQVKELFEYYNAFPVLNPGKKDEYIPYNVIAPHEVQARANHGGQTLQRLAERGGLSWSEILAVLNDKTWKELEWSFAGPGDDVSREKVLFYIQTHTPRINCARNVDAVRAE